MIDFLLGVPGKLKAISDYLSGTLYPYITSRTANLNDTITSRAPASTALTNATWTDTRAGKLDLIATPPPTPMKAPIAAGWPNKGNAGNYALCANLIDRLGGTLLETAATSSTLALSVAGSGVIDFLCTARDTASGGSYMTLVIDGVTLITGASASTGTTKTLIGYIITDPAGAISSAVPGRIPFHSSFQIYTWTTSALSSGMIRYWRTS